MGGIKGTWRAAEVRHIVPWLESLKRAQKRLLVKVQSSYSKGPQQFENWQYHRMTTRNSSGASWTLEDKLFLKRMVPEKRPKPLGGAQKTMSESQITGH